MYESFFGLRKRPYAAAPDPRFVVETPAFVDAISRLDRCVRRGAGIAVLTGPAGAGKTLLLHRLAAAWEPEFRVVLLPNAGFPTRRGLLQSMLAELGRPYQKLGETELRLELTAVARSSRADFRPVVVLFDEAHRHSERIFEEVRLIANPVEDGEPLVRVVLAGQVELEERLAEPSLAGLNERVGELVTLPRMTSEESRKYLQDRAAVAGVSLAGLFEREAVEVIVQACGGVPRCLNQLADHGLLLGFVAERRPVDAGLVREALDDLKRLPLHWHDPLPEAGGQVSGDDTESSMPSRPLHQFDAVVEIGGLDTSEVAEREFGGDDQWTDGSACDAAEPVHVDATSGPEREVDMPSAEAVCDRYARLDAEQAKRLWHDLMERCGAVGSGTPAEAGVVVDETFVPDVDEAQRGDNNGDGRPAANPLEILDRIEPLIAAALEEAREFGAEVVEPPRVGAAAENSDPMFAASDSPAASVATAVAPVRPAVSRAGAEHRLLFRELRRKAEKRSL